MTDEQRTDSLGCYGSAWAHTPHLDRLAAEGAVFRNAVTPSPVCMPARTSLLFAKYPSQTGVWYNDTAEHPPSGSLMQRFRDAGYGTASFGKQHYVCAEPAFEVEGGNCLSPHVEYFDYHERYDESDWGVVKYPGEARRWIFAGRFPADHCETTEHEAVDLGLEWLERRDPARPFFLRVSFNGPHTPVVPPAPFDEIIPAEAIRLPEACDAPPEGQPSWLAEHLSKTSSSALLSAEEIRKMRRCYYGEVAFLDDEFGRLLDRIKQRGLLKNTIVVYLSDHGTHLGDYGLVQKQTFYNPVVNVPYIFRYPPKVARGVTIQTPVETQTLLPTLLELAGLDAPGAGCSASIADVLASGGEPQVRPVFSELTLESQRPYVQHEGRLVMVRDGDWKLSLCLDPEVHDAALYNLTEDPDEILNLSDDASCAGQRERLIALIRKHISAAESG